MLDKITSTHPRKAHQSGPQEGQKKAPSCLKMAEPAKGKVSMSIANFTTIETTRLRLRHFRDSDLPVFIAYRNDPVVATYQSWEGISEAEAFAFLQEQKEIQPGVPGQGMQIAIECKET